MKFSRPVGRAWTRRLTAWALLMALSACGAGVMGTGAGTTRGGDDDIPYTPGGLCTAPFAQAALACPPATTDPDLGTATVQWADANKSNEGASVLATLEGHTLSLQVPCKASVFLGNWGVLQDGSLAFVGRYVSLDAPGGLPAILQVLAAPEEPDAVGRLQVLDSSGSILVGPWLVRRAEGLVQFAACAR